jgi:hypothetical protein
MRHYRGFMKVDILKNIKDELILKIKAALPENTFVAVNDDPIVGVIEGQYKVVFDNETAFGGSRPLGYAFNIHVTVINKVLTDISDEEQVIDTRNDLSLIVKANEVKDELNGFNFGYTTNGLPLQHTGTSNIQSKVYTDDVFVAMIKVSFYGEYFEDAIL